MADPGFTNGGGQGRPEGVSPLHWGRVWGGDDAPSSDKFYDFGSQSLAAYLIVSTAVCDVFDRVKAGVLHEQFDGVQQLTAWHVSGEPAQLRHRQRQYDHLQRLRRWHTHIQRRR